MAERTGRLGGLKQLRVASMSTVIKWACFLDKKTQTARGSERTVPHSNWGVAWPKGPSRSEPQARQGPKNSESAGFATLGARTLAEGWHAPGVSLMQSIAAGARGPGSLEGPTRGILEAARHTPLPT